MSQEACKVILVRRDGTQPLDTSSDSVDIALKVCKRMLADTNCLGENFKLVIMDVESLERTPPSRTSIVFFFTRDHIKLARRVRQRGCQINVFSSQFPEDEVHLIPAQCRSIELFRNLLKYV